MHVANEAICLACGAANGGVVGLSPQRQRFRAAAYSKGGWHERGNAQNAFRAGGSRQPYVLTSERGRFFLRAVWRANCVLISGRSVGGLLCGCGNKGQVICLYYIQKNNAKKNAAFVAKIPRLCYNLQGLIRICAIFVRCVGFLPPDRVRSRRRKEVNNNKK